MYLRENTQAIGAFILDGTLRCCSSAHIDNYPLAFVERCPPCPTPCGHHDSNHFGKLPGRGLSLFSFFLYTTVSIIVGYLHNSADGGSAVDETDFLM
jgi:hypothetical protein